MMGSEMFSDVLWTFLDVSDVLTMTSGFTDVFIEVLRCSPYVGLVDPV